MQSDWSGLPAAYDHQPSMPVVLWDEEAPVVQVLSLHEDWKQPKIEILLYNPHDRPLTVLAELADAWHRDPPAQLRQELRLGPNEQRRVSFAARDSGPAGLHTTSVRISGGQQVYYERTWKWSMYRPDDAWPIADEQRQAVDLQFKYYPYLWVGDGERGLCWFAETDRDWVLDGQAPTVDLTREDDTLTMRVHFITQPGRLAGAHRIVFGLQATPTKPMPDGWRRWVASRAIEGGRPVRWVGACYYWGGLSYDVYPYRYGFEFFDKLNETRQTGQIDKEFIERWMATLQKDLAPRGSERDEFLRRHVDAGFWAAKTSPWSEGWRLFGYTNPRGVGFHVPEFATFQDEWLRYRWFNRNWGASGDVGYDVDPCRSFQDYALGERKVVPGGSQLVVADVRNEH